MNTLQNTHHIKIHINEPNIVSHQIPINPKQYHWNSMMIILVSPLQFFLHHINYTNNVESNSANFEINRI